MCSFLQQFLQQIEILLTKPMEEFMQTEVRELKELSKKYMKATDQYDAAVSKFSQVKKGDTKKKDEGEVEIAECKKNYRIASLDLVFKLNQIQAKKRLELLERVCAFMYLQRTYFHQGYELFLGLDTYMNNLSSQLQQYRKQFEAEQKRLSASKLRLAEMAGKEATRSDITYQGYLFKKGRNRFGKEWKRRYFMINEGKLSYCKSQGQTVSSRIIDLLVSTVKVYDDANRNFCFEVISPTDSLVLQAENQQEMNKWIAILQNATTHKILTHSEDVSSPSHSNVSVGSTSSLSTPTPPRQELTSPVLSNTIAFTSSNQSEETRGRRSSSGSSGTPNLAGGMKTTTHTPEMNVKSPPPSPLITRPSPQSRHPAIKQYSSPHVKGVIMPKSLDGIVTTASSSSSPPRKGSIGANDKRVLNRNSPNNNNSVQSCSLSASSNNLSVGTSQSSVSMTRAQSPQRERTNRSFNDHNVNPRKKLPTPPPPKTTKNTSPGSVATSESNQLQLLYNINPRNKFCADCGAEDPEWAVINLGILICIECGGVHRSLGSRISKVRSLILDKIDTELWQLMKAIGNEKANNIFENKNMAITIPRATPQCSREMRIQWISAKYVQRKFMPPYLGLSREEDLLKAVKSQNLDSVYRLLAQKADVCYQSPNDYHRTCLHFAAQEGVVTIAEFLVQNGAKVDSTDRLGNTPLHYAVMNNHIAIVSLLIRHNAKCDIKNNEGIEEKIQRIE